MARSSLNLEVVGGSPGSPEPRRQVYMILSTSRESGASALIVTPSLRWTIASNFWWNSPPLRTQP